MKREDVISWMNSNEQELVELLAQMVKAKPINGALSDEDDERKVQKIVWDYLTDIGLKPEENPVDLSELEAYRGLPGYIPGHTDEIDFRGRNNVFTKISGTGEGRNLMLVGHADVVPVADPEKWIYPPFEARIADDYIWGRGTVDMLAGIAGMLFTLKALRENHVKLKGDLWFGSIVGEETGGTGMLAFSEYLRKAGARIDAAIMGEPTDLQLSLLCRGIIWVDVEVEGKTGHLEVTQPHWSQGGVVSAIDKALYLHRAVMELCAEWEKRPDKNHKLLNLPCQIKLSKISGGHHHSSYPDKCVLSYNIQVLPQETDENGLGTSVRKEFEEYIAGIAGCDPWMKSHPPKVKWLLEANCGEVPEDHPFVGAFMDSARKVVPDMIITGSEFHTDNEWPEKLAGIPTVNFGPGNPALAHNDNEKCSLRQLQDYAKVIAYQCMDWCGVE
ncbi:MAG: ArgE/DapE family deacylase [Lachnospiraceae bacterium]|nr:ArgE/DapE family deacylase [Lachnospiraceae bacterium]